MVIDAFHTQIDNKKMDVKDLVLRLGMKSSSGVVNWVPLRPKQWSNIVCDGDEIRVGDNDEEISGLYDPIPLVTFKRYPAGRSVTMLLPKTIEVSCGLISNWKKGTLGLITEYLLRS